MSNTISLTNKNYLAVTAVISAGALIGCDYCIPVLVALLTISVVNYFFNLIINSQQSTRDQLHGFKEGTS